MMFYEVEIKLIGETMRKEIENIKNPYETIAILDNIIAEKEKEIDKLRAILDNIIAEKEKEIDKLKAMTGCCFSCRYWTARKECTKIMKFTEEGFFCSSYLGKQQ